MTVSVALSPIPVLQFLDNTGRPAVGGSLTTQVGGINYAAYSDNLGNTPLPNPIPLNSRGEISTAAGATSELFLQQGIAYTLILKDAAGNQLWSVSNVVAALSGQSVNLPAVSGSANAIVLTNANPITVVAGTIQWFIPIAANTAATTINDDNNGAVSVHYLTKALVGGEIQIGVPTQIISDGTVWNLAWSAKGPAADYYIDSGTVNAIAVTINTAAPATSAGQQGMRIKVKVANTNTSSSVIITINGNSWGVGLSDQGTSPPPGSLILNGIYDFILGPVVAALENPSRATGSFTITLTGMTAGTTGTVNYAILPDGKTVYVWIAANILGTSNTTAMTGTGIPSLLSPTTSHRIALAVQDNSSANGDSGNLLTGTSTTWTFGNTPVGAAFTSGSQKGLFLFEFSYSLD